MCRFCLSRRAFTTASLAAIPFAAAARPPSRPPGLLEPALRLPASDGPRTVAVTLDACPGRFDPRIADVLIALNIKATIFVTDIWMRWNPEALALLLAHPSIFALQNHGAQHLPPVLGTAPIYGLEPAGTLPAIRAEVENGAAAIIATGAPAPRWYRGAAGLYSPAALPAITQLGFKIAGYSLNSDEGASLPAAAVAARIANAQNGDVIEGHINQPHRASGAGIATGLASLHAAGTKFVWI